LSSLGLDCAEIFENNLVSCQSLGCVVSFQGYGSHYWIFLNPAHKTEFVLPECWNDMTYFIDFLFRVIQAYLIYQIIQGFRKFSRPL